MLTFDGWTLDCVCWWRHRLGGLHFRSRWLPSLLAQPGHKILRSVVRSHRKWTSRFLRLSCWMRDVERRAPQPRRHLLRGSFAPVISTENQGDWCCEWLDGLRHKHRMLHDFPCFYALQEADPWTTSAMNVPGYIVYGTDHGRTAILCPREVNHFRRSWVDNERAQPFWWALPCCFQFTCRTVVAMRWTSSRPWSR